jgi:hypothetical protein
MESYELIGRDTLDTDREDVHAMIWVRADPKNMAHRVRTEQPPCSASPLRLPFCPTCTRNGGEQAERLRQQITRHARAPGSSVILAPPSPRAMPCRLPSGR